MSSKYKQAQEALKSLDIYGYPITLTYKNQSSYKTILGGILSLITGCLVIIFAGYELAKLIRRDVNPTSYSEVIDTSTAGVYNITREQFDIAFYLPPNASDYANYRNYRPYVYYLFYNSTSDTVNDTYVVMPKCKTIYNQTWQYITSLQFDDFYCLPDEFLSVKY